ncbi:hypothetical protein [Bacillus nakamurai]|uniref:hypothetical protein n=1 Tax=Bacillus nakamurai TaxID=1793963 RepID=UPI001E53C293|nr:hypothetical protein [Bacillus nakamurai]MCC9022334.1 hypothetical protein [Bacillus nakamurai]
MNRNQALISSICYFSVFIAPLIVPIVAYFVVDEKETKRHAIRAFVSHIIPFAGGLIVIAGVVGGAITAQEESLLPIFVMITGAIIYFLIVIGMVIWNVVQGIKVLRQE